MLTELYILYSFRTHCLFCDASPKITNISVYTLWTSSARKKHVQSDKDNETMTDIWQEIYISGRHYNLHWVRYTIEWSMEHITLPWILNGVYAT